VTTPSLPQVARQHHERLMFHVDQIPAAADRLLDASPSVARESTREVGEFLVDLLLPHIDATEQTLYPELERMFQNRHSMKPMRREHDELRRLVAQYTAMSDALDREQVTLGATLAIRRVMFSLYALLKVHLAEEQAYQRIIDKGVPAEIADMLAAALEHPVSG
jgi:hemerythrin-like domain-containing protein